MPRAIGPNELKTSPFQEKALLTGAAADRSRLAGLRRSSWEPLVPQGGGKMVRGTRGGGGATAPAPPLGRAGVSDPARRSTQRIQGLGGRVGSLRVPRG